MGQGTLQLVWGWPGSWWPTWGPARPLPSRSCGAPRPPFRCCSGRCTCLVLLGTGRPGAWEAVALGRGWALALTPGHLPHRVFPPLGALQPPPHFWGNYSRESSLPPPEGTCFRAVCVQPGCGRSLWEPCVCLVVWGRGGCSGLHGAMDVGVCMGVPVKRPVSSKESERRPALVLLFAPLPSRSGVPRESLPLGEAAARSPGGKAPHTHTLGFRGDCGGLFLKESGRRRP